MSRNGYNTDARLLSVIEQYTGGSLDNGSDHPELDTDPAVALWRDGCRLPPLQNATPESGEQMNKPNNAAPAAVAESLAGTDLEIISVYMSRLEARLHLQRLERHMAHINRKRTLSPSERAMALADTALLAEPFRQALAMAWTDTYECREGHGEAA